MKNLSFSTGVEEYRLNDRVTVTFNPTDAVFLERLADLFQKLDQLQEEVSALQEGTPEEEVFPLAKELDRRMRELLDNFFGQPVCDPLFSGMNLFASAGGLPVWANLLLALSEEVETAMQGELTAREKRIARYTAKYKK